MNQDHHSYTINFDVPEKGICTDHLKIGEENQEGKKVSVNNYYIYCNDKPIIPITGEIHFYRYPGQYWDESFLIDLDQESIPDFTETLQFTEIKEATFIPQYRPVIEC